MLTLLLILICCWISIGITVFIYDVWDIILIKEKDEILILLLLLTMIGYSIFGTPLFLQRIGINRLFCILTFGHNLRTYYGYGCSLQDDFLHCNKCGYIPINQERYYNVPDNLK